MMQSPEPTVKPRAMPVWLSLVRYERSAKGGVLSQGCLGELVIKKPPPDCKPCSLLGRDSGFIGSRVEETEARINRKYRNSLGSL